MPDPRPIDTPSLVSTATPKAPEPTLRNQLNAFRHDITGQLIVFTPGEQQAYAKHCKIILDHFAPVGAYERDVTQSIADDRWRLKRARSIESSAFALAMAEHSDENTGHPQVDDAFTQARTWRADAHNLHLLTIYEQRIQRACDKNIAYLKTLQTERKEAADKAMRDAKILLQFARVQGKPYEPKAYFEAAPQTPESVFSTAEVAREITREKMLDDAEAYYYGGRLPQKKEVAKASAGESIPQSKP